MRSEVTKLDKSQLEIKITVPHSRVGGVFEKVIENAAKEIEIEGFRKGHAPKNLVLEKVDKGKAYGEVVNRIVSETYNAAVKEHLLKPIINPKVEIIQFEPESKKDFIFKAVTTERPEVKLGDYKSELAKLSGSSLNEVLQTVLKTTQVEIPEILTEGEVSRMLSRLIDQTAKLGLTIEQYLQSANKTAEQLRAEYAKQAEETLKAELVLDELAKVEKIEVTDSEIEEAIKANPDPKVRKEFEKEENKWYIGSILKRNKTIQKLVELAK